MGLINKMQQYLKSYTDYWKTNKPNPVGISKIGTWSRWYVLYCNGTSKKVSILWNIVPSKIRAYYLYRRYINTIIQRNG